jgi:hypothetical protein
MENYYMDEKGDKTENPSEDGPFPLSGIADLLSNVTATQVACFHAYSSTTYERAFSGCLPQSRYPATTTPSSSHPKIKI